MTDWIRWRKGEPMPPDGLYWITSQTTTIGRAVPKVVIGIKNGSFRGLPLEEDQIVALMPCSIPEPCEDD